MNLDDIVVLSPFIFVVLFMFIISVLATSSGPEEENAVVTDVVQAQEAPAPEQVTVVTPSPELHVTANQWTTLQYGAGCVSLLVNNATGEFLKARPVSCALASPIIVKE